MSDVRKTKFPQTKIVQCEGCKTPFKVPLKARGRPKRFHNQACEKKTWDSKHPRQAVPE